MTDLLSIPDEQRARYESPYRLMLPIVHAFLAGTWFLLSVHYFAKSRTGLGLLYLVLAFFSLSAAIRRQNRFHS